MRRPASIPSPRSWRSRSPLSRRFAARFDRGEPPATEQITLIAENKWRAARDGLGAKLIDFANDTERSAPDAIRELVERSRPAAEELGCAAELDLVEGVLERGTGADEQLRSTRRAGVCWRSRSGLRARRFARFDRRALGYPPLVAPRRLFICERPSSVEQPAMPPETATAGSRFLRSPASPGTAPSAGGRCVSSESSSSGS